MTESWRSPGRSATRVRIGSGSVSWRRRLWALTAPMPRSAQTAAIRSLVAQAGAGGPAVGELRLLVGEREVLALVLLGLDAADLVRRGRVVEQQHDQAADRLQAVAGELVAGAGGEQPALAGVEDDASAPAGRWPMQGTSWPIGHQHAGEPLDALGGDLAARVGGELELVERDAHERARRVGGRERGDVEQRGRREGRRLGVGHGVLSEEGRVMRRGDARRPWRMGSRARRASCGGDGATGCARAEALARGSVARGLELDAVGVDAQVELGQGDGGGGEAARRADVQRAVAELGGGEQPRR